MLRIDPVPALIPIEAKRFVAILLVLALSLSTVLAGVTISPNGIVMTGADGIVMTGADGIVMTGADGYITYLPNGIVMTGADGIVMTGADTFATPNSVRIASADGANISHANGIVMTGADGIVMTGADGATYYANSVTVTLANGIVMTGADGIVMTGADGVQSSGANGIVMTGADGIVMTGVDGIVMTGADAIRAVGPNGVVFSVVPAGVSFAGVTGIVMTGADGIVMTGADGIVMTGADGIALTGTDAHRGLRSVDPELALLLNSTLDDSGINAVLVYHQTPTETDLAELQSLGFLGGTRFRALPMVVVTGTRQQIAAVSHLPAIRSIYTNRTLTFNTEPEVRAITGVERARRDSDLIVRNSGLQLTGRNVTVAVLDTGIDSSHSDLAGRVVKNVKLADIQSLGVGFNYPVNSESLPNTDQLYGHGTFVAGIIAGNGSHAEGKFAGVAPNAKLVGLSAGDATLVYILGGLDYLLANNATSGVRVVNCSFSANTPYDTNDPVNVATKMLTEAGVSVVFSAGNTGSGAHTLNPYAVAPWVVSVGATDTQAQLATFSSRGDFASSLFHPTLVAPGVNVVSLRASGANVTGVLGLAGVDAQRLNWTELPHYTTASGTSFSAPQVAGAIALMLEANPGLTPADVKEVLQRTATPLPDYYEHEVGAGMLNVHAAVLQAAFPKRLIGDWRTLNSGQVEFYNDPLTTFTGYVHPGVNFDKTLQLPNNTLFAAIQVGWGPMWSINDLGLKVYNTSGALAGEANTLNFTELTGRQEHLSLVRPNGGNWRLSVRNTLGLVGTPQSFNGVLQVGRANYAPMTDLGNLNPSVRDAIYQNIRTLAMRPIGSKFRPELTATRSDVAMALVAGARVPQYLAAQPMYPDVRDTMTRVFVESAQTATNGSLFPDAASGSQFRPYDGVTRIAAAVALVRAAGLRSEAEARTGTPLALLDAATIPSELRGYVSLAISEELLTSNSLFRPQSPLTRGELAQAIVNLQRRR